MYRFIRIEYVFAITFLIRKLLSCRLIFFCVCVGPENLLALGKQTKENSHIDLISRFTMREISHNKP